MSTLFSVPKAMNMQDYARKVIGSDCISEEQLKQIREQQEVGLISSVSHIIFVAIVMLLVAIVADVYFQAAENTENMCVLL